MPWRVRRADVDFFLRDLWKDLRPFPQAYDRDVFAKECFEPSLATAEAATLLILREKIGYSQFARPLAVQGSVLLMEKLKGARFFDLIRHLRHLERERNDGMAIDVIQILLSRATEKLGRTQVELVETISVFSQESYPLEQKLRGLLNLFIRVMDLRAPADWPRSLEDFVDYWEGNCVVVPFRDATTKNMIVRDSRLALQNDTDDADTTQRNSVAGLLDSEPLSYWNGVGIVDIDFASVVHKTSPEDDPISLLCHEMTYGFGEVSPRAFVLHPSLGQPDPFRCAATFLVRYLRFGGRKLAYKLINAQGFRIRFAFDDPLFYFQTLPEVVSKLSEEFVAQFTPLLELIELIAASGRNPSQNDHALMSVDHLRKYYPSRDYTYWQQNPSEVGPPPDPSKSA